MNDTKQSGSATTGHAKMRPRARLISLIGDELVSDERVSVVELVKNSYDADATRVDIEFRGDNPASPDTLVVSDDGCGMDLDKVLQSWFEPGTVTKKRGVRSAGGRLYQGAKGVGRFAAARLAPAMFLETRSGPTAPAVTVLLNWGRFDDESFLDEVEIEYETGAASDIQRGTRLTLIGIHQKKPWGRDDFVALHERLSRLISPFEEIQDFKINLSVPGHPDLTGEVEPHPITRRPRYRLEGELSPSGHFSGQVFFNDAVEKTFKSHALGKKGETVACGGFHVEIRAWDRDREGLSPFMLDFGIGLRDVRRLLDQASGLSIYRDGFRVHPYGEPGNDWLQLDARSRLAPTSRLANNQIIGALRIGRKENPSLVDRTTREGLVHNAAYASLLDWVERVLALLEEQRYRLRPRETTEPEEVRTLFEPFDLAPVVREADRQLGATHPVSVLVRKSDEDIREGVRRLQEHYSRLLMTAGLGQMVDLVIHEIGAPVGRANRELDHLERLLKDGLEDEASRRRALESIHDIKGWLEHVVALRARLDPKTAGKRGRATSFDVADEVDGNVMLFENLIANQKIVVTTKRPKTGTIVHMTRSSLGQVLANLLDNSIYWLTRHHGDGKGGNIEISWKHLPGGFKLTVADDGPGVAEEDRERIFDPYFSTKATGMGLGLYVARQVMERYGTLLCVDSSPPGGACFEATFVKNVGL